jgi:hypothetical protein
LVQAKATGAGQSRRGVKGVETADLEVRVARLELEARELEARERIHLAKARLGKLRAEQGTKRKKGAGPA